MAVAPYCSDVMRPNPNLARADRTVAQSSSRRTVQGAVGVPFLIVAALVGVSYPILAGVTIAALVALWKYAGCVVKRRRPDTTGPIRVSFAGVRVEV